MHLKKKQILFGILLLAVAQKFYFNNNNMHIFSLLCWWLERY